MALITTDSANYYSIANAIREVNGTNTLYKPRAMAPAILAAFTGKADVNHTHIIDDVENLWTQLNSKSPTDHTHNSLLDIGNNQTTTFAYSKEGLSSTSWFAAWNGYELRAISPANTLSTIGAAAASHTHSYLPLSGGTLTGQVKKAGTSSSWIKGRDNATFRNHTIGDYSPFASIKTTNGSWEIGAYNNSSFYDDLVFSYCTDTNYNANSNQTTAQIRFLENGTIVGNLSGTASSASSVAWGNITGKPSTFTPASHTHSYAATSHTHSISDITNLQSSLNAKQKTISTGTASPSGGSSGDIYIKYS